MEKAGTKRYKKGLTQGLKKHRAFFILSNQWAGGLVVMTSPLQGESREFESLPAHFFLFQKLIRA